MIWQTTNKIFVCVIVMVECKNSVTNAMKFREGIDGKYLRDAYTSNFKNRIHNILIGILPWQKAQFTSSYKIAEKTGDRQSWNGQERNAKPVFNYKKIASLTFSSKVDAKSIRDNFISITYLPLPRGPELNSFTSKVHRILLHSRRSFCVYLLLCLLVSTCLQESLL